MAGLSMYAFAPYRVVRKNAAAYITGAALLVTVGACAAYARAIIVSDKEWLVHRVPDDAFYYLEIGQRLSRGEGSTFDGVHQTNGFHPLWQLVVAGLAHLFQGDALVRVALAVNLMTVVVGMALVGWLLARVITAPLAAAAVAVSTAHLLSYLVDGMETSLTFAAFALLLVLLHKADDSRKLLAFLAVGVAGGVLVLARLDAVLILVIMTPLLIVRWRRSLGKPSLAALSTVAVVAPYVVWNLVEFGHVLSVSGTVKQQIVADWIRDSYGSRISSGYMAVTAREVTRYPLRLLSDLFPRAPVRLLVVAFAIIGLLSMAHRRGWNKPASTEQFVLAAALCGLAGKALADLVLSPFWATTRYAGLQLVGLCMIVIVLAWHGLVTVLRTKALSVLLPGVALLSLLYLVVSPFRGGLLTGKESFVPSSWQDENLLVSTWIRTEGPQTTYGSPDTGLLGFELDGHVRVVNLDGLVNTYGYASQLHRRVAPLQLYRSQGVQVLVARRDPADASSVPACAHELWRSPHALPWTGLFVKYRVISLPIRVWDLRTCS